MFCIATLLVGWVATVVSASVSSKWLRFKPRCVSYGTNKTTTMKRQPRHAWERNRKLHGLQKLVARNQSYGLEIHSQPFRPHGYFSIERNKHKTGSRSIWIHSCKLVNGFFLRVKLSL
jgi:hypothetical protein